jgi:Domain of unknown function (DUF4160)
MSPRAIDDIEGFRFGFFSNENNEPPHVHITKGDGMAKFWMGEDVFLAESYGFKKQELKKAWLLAIKYKDEILNSWNVKKYKR